MQNVNVLNKTEYVIYRNLELTEGSASNVNLRQTPPRAFPNSDRPPSPRSGRTLQSMATSHPLGWNESIAGAKLAAWLSNIAKG